MWLQIVINAIKEVEENNETEWLNREVIYESGQWGWHFSRNLNILGRQSIKMLKSQKGKKA